MWQAGWHFTRWHHIACFLLSLSLLLLCLCLLFLSSSFHAYSFYPPIFFQNDFLPFHFLWYHFIFLLLSAPYISCHLFYIYRPFCCFSLLFLSLCHKPFYCHSSMYLMAVWKFGCEIQTVSGDFLNELLCMCVHIIEWLLIFGDFSASSTKIICCSLYGVVEYSVSQNIQNM